MKNNNNLIWIDLEMTGLDPDKERIIEIATIVTDAHLNILEEGPVMAVHQPQHRLDAMDEWNTTQHGKSGLVDRVLKSKIDESEAQKSTIEFLSRFVDKGKSPMCGNSICQDRQFLNRYMPELAAFFHYRNLDVSSLKELVKRWKPSLMSGAAKQSQHLALQDIRDSIDELVYYRTHFINLSTSKAP